MRTLVTGARGQLGSDLMKVLSGDVIGLGHSDVDICYMDSVTDILQRIQPHRVINAAAYNKVDQAEDEPHIAWQVNALGPRNLAVACESIGATLVHISTDYVFGRDESRLMPFNENEPAAPVSAYGVSKLAGEHFVRSNCSRHFVIRTCGVYGHAARDGAGKGNFVESMIRLGAERDELKVINNQFCTPTSSLDLADAILALLETHEFGLFHFTNNGSTTWYDFACEIFQLMNINVTVKPIPATEYPTKARRPGFSLLDCTRFEAATGNTINNWRTALSTYLSQRTQMLAETETLSAN